MTRSRVFLLTGALLLGLFLVGSVLALRLTILPTGSTALGKPTLEVSAPGADLSEVEMTPGTTKTLNLGTADRLKVSGAWKVVLVPGPEGQARLTAPEASTLHMKIRNEGGTLSLGTSGNSRGRPVLEVSLPRLKDLDASGASEINLAGLQTERFVLDTSGACTIVGSGTVKSLELHSSGDSTVDWGEVQTSEVWVDSSGAGNILLRCSGRVGGQVSGAVNLTVRGNPMLQVNSSGAAEVRSGS